jgi:transposase
MEQEPVVADTLGQNVLPESEMINRDKNGAVVELANRGTPKKAIARMLGLDPKTVRRILRSPEFKSYQRAPADSKVLAGFQDFLTRRAPEVDFNAVALHREAKLLGYTGCYEMIKTFIRPMREELRLAVEATLRFETAPGHQGQVDWGTSKVWLGDHLVRVRFFALVLGYSRRMFACAFRSERLANLTAGHEAAFAWFGGSPRELLYDNPKTIVTGRNGETGEVEMNATFRDFLRHYGIRPRFCRPYRARTKGKIESGIKYIKRNFLAGRRFRDLDDLNRQLEEWVVNVADVRVHGTTGVRPIDRFPQEKLLDLRRVPPYKLENSIRRQVGTDARVSFRANRYSVPWRLAGKQVEVRTENDELLLLHGGQEVARHTLLAGRFQERVDPAHFRGLFRMIVEEEGSKPLHDPRFPVEDVMVRDLSLYDRVAGIGGAQ